MTRRKQLQDMIKRMKEDREKLFKGCEWRDMENILHLFSEAPGTRFSGIDRTIKNLDDRIATAEKELASLPKESALENAKRTYEYCGATNASTKDYIAALEACRPWVIRNSKSGALLAFRNLYTAVFLSESEAKSYLISVSSGLTPDDWEVVQWEGNQ